MGGVPHRRHMSAWDQNQRILILSLLFTHAALPSNNRSRNHSFSKSAKLFVSFILSLRGLRGKQMNLRIKNGRKQGISYIPDGEWDSQKRQPRDQQQQEAVIMGKLERQNTTAAQRQRHPAEAETPGRTLGCLPSSLLQMSTGALFWWSQPARRPQTWKPKKHRLEGPAFL